jgi:integrase
MAITMRTVVALKPGEMVWSGGFGVKATSTGERIYVLDYRIGRRKRRFTIGRHGAPWTPTTATKEANRLRALVASGIDPLTQKVAARTGPTMRELAERFMAEHVDVKLKPSTARTYRGILDRIIVPALGTRAVADVTRADVAALHHRRRTAPADANRMTMLLSKMMSMAERWGLKPEGLNPARNVEKFREQARQRYLSPAEFQRLGAALVAAEPDALIPVAAIRLLIYTGARRGEVLSLRWRDVDLARSCLNLPDSKTGFKVVHLNAPARAVLESLPRIEGNPYVLPGVRRGQHLVNLTSTWDTIRTAADLKDVRLHDLRHSLASVGVNAGLSLPLVGGLLGHTQAQTTKRYAHLSADPLKAAAELVGERIAQAMEGAR